MKKLLEASSNPLRQLELIRDYIYVRNIDTKYKEILYDAINKCYKEYNSELSGGFPELTPEQIEYINSCTNASFSVKNGRVNVNGHFNARLGGKGDFKGIKFGTIKGHFTCRKMGLTSTEGFPIKVNGNFDCSNNDLTNLEGVPEKVEYSFDCSNNKLKSLDGCPNTVRYIDAHNNPIEILFRDPRDIKLSLWELIVDKGTPLKGISDNINYKPKEPNIVFFDVDTKSHYNVFSTIKGLLSSIEGIDKLSYIEILSNRGII